MDGERKAQAGCVNASNPFHECADYCVQRSLDSDLKIKGAKSPAHNGRRNASEVNTVHNGRRNASEVNNVNPDCFNASNPFHQCAEYCTKKKQSEMGKSGWSIFSPKSSSSERSNGAKSGSFAFPVLSFSPRSSPRERSDRGKLVQNGVNPNCVNASNPFHKCTDYCSNTSGDAVHEIILTKSALQNGDLWRKETKKSGDVSIETNMHTTALTLGDLIARDKRMEEKTKAANRKNQDVTKVDPRCPDAANPFHECAEYCLQKIARIGRSEALKPDRSNGSIKSATDNSGVDPRCPDASNPFHKCADYCFEKIREAA